MAVVQSYRRGFDFSKFYRMISLILHKNISSIIDRQNVG